MCLSISRLKYSAPYAALHRKQSIILEGFLRCHELHSPAADGALLELMPRQPQHAADIFAFAMPSRIVAD